MAFAAAAAVSATATAQFYHVNRFAGSYNNYGYSGGYGAAGYGAAGYGASGYGGYGYGYNINNGQIGPGYNSAGNLYQVVNRAIVPQTVTNYQPLISAITSLPGWNGSTGAVHRRVRTYRQVAQNRTPTVKPFDSTGKILWPGAILNDSATTALRQKAEAAVHTVIAEYRSTGHGSVKPVVEAKNRLSALENEALPRIKSQNATDASNVEIFFSSLEKDLDAMTYVY